MKLIEEGGKERTVIEEKIKTMVKNFQVHYFCFNYKFAKVLMKYYTTNYTGSRGGSMTAATFKMDLFVMPLGSNLFVV